MSNNQSPPSFARDIQPLFREVDRDAMSFIFDLWNYDDVSTQSQNILKQLKRGSMPCDSRWPSDQVDLFARWIEDGMAK